MGDQLRPFIVLVGGCTIDPTYTRFWRDSLDKTLSQPGCL